MVKLKSPSWERRNHCLRILCLFLQYIPQNLCFSPLNRITGKHSWNSTCSWSKRRTSCIIASSNYSYLDQYPTVMTIKAVIFDLDGTLLDTEPLSDTAIILAFGDRLPVSVKEQLGGSLPWEIKKQILGLRGAEWIPMIESYAQEHWGVANDDTPPLSEFWDNWERNLNYLCSDVNKCSGAAEFVEQLSRHNVPMAIATSSRKSAVDKKRTKHEKMFECMAEIVTGDEPAVKNGKPAPDIFIEAARRLGVHPSECIVFEDSLSGVQSGKAAGCIVVAVPEPRMDKSVFEPVADIVLEDLYGFDGTQWGMIINMKDGIRHR